MKGRNFLYRGLKLKKEEIAMYLPGETTNLIGYTSTSKKMEMALRFAFLDCTADRIPVLFIIEFHGQHGLFEMTSAYTAFEDEDEVLVQDGLEYLIMSNEQLTMKDSGMKYQVIQLKYPA